MIPKTRCSLRTGSYSKLASFPQVVWKQHFYYWKVFPSRKRKRPWRMRCLGKCWKNAPFAPWFGGRRHPARRQCYRMWKLGRSLMWTLLPDLTQVVAIAFGWPLASRSVEFGFSSRLKIFWSLTQSSCSCSWRLVGCCFGWWDPRLGVLVIALVILCLIVNFIVNYFRNEGILSQKLVDLIKLFKEIGQN